MLKHYICLILILKGTQYFKKKSVQIIYRVKNIPTPNSLFAKHFQPYLRADFQMIFLLLLKWSNDIFSRVNVAFIGLPTLPPTA